MVEGIVIPYVRDASGKEGLGFRGHRKASGVCGVIKGFDAKTIAGCNQTMIILIPEDQGKFTTEMVEKIQTGEMRTAFLKRGDAVRIEVRDDSGHSIFGAIEQTVCAA